MERKSPPEIEFEIEPGLPSVELRESEPHLGDSFEEGLGAAPVRLLDVSRQEDSERHGPRRGASVADPDASVEFGVDPEDPRGFGASVPAGRREGESFISDELRSAGSLRAFSRFEVGEENLVGAPE